MNNYKTQTSDIPVKTNDGFGFAYVEQADYENDSSSNDYYSKGKRGGIFYRVQLFRNHILVTLRKRLHRYLCLSRIFVGCISLILSKFFIMFMISIWIVFILLVAIVIPSKSTSLTTSLLFPPSFRSTHEHKPPMRMKPPMRILHIVTTSSEYNNGRRGTVRGQDRLQEVLIPALSEGVTSMVEADWHVDVYLICGFELSPERKQLIIDTLPDGVGLQVWNDAAPLGYDGGEKLIKPVQRALARQHRFVIADKLDQYDFFSVWEDDMLITAKHIQHYLNVSNELDRLKQEASSKQISVSEKSITGSMSYEQLERVFPGFIRVEVLKPNFEAQHNLDPIHVDLDFSDNETPDFHSIDPEPCCSISSTTSQKLKSLIPPHPNSEDVIVWEAAVEGYGVREFPQPSSIGWVALQPGPEQKDNSFVHGYWAGDSGVYKNHTDKPQEKPFSMIPRLFGQQAGFMATRKQIKSFERLCQFEFLPPFTKFHKERMLWMAQEFWLGGLQLWGKRKGACNFQRILLLEPDMFSKHLIYHTSNNKQSTIDRERLVKANNLLGQLNSVKKAAMASMSSSVRKQSGLTSIERVK